MLRRLFIRAYVIVEELELEFDAGFGTLTGETGAGKSILIDALSLALGGRADGTVVRPGRERAEIFAEFQMSPESDVTPWLAVNDFAADDGVLLLRRVIDAGGRSRAYINGIPATMGQLREVAEFLADIHGQHLHHSLARPEAQRALLDSHAGLSLLARSVAEQHRRWQKLAAARADAERDAEAGLREREALEWQVQELTQLELTQTGWAEAWQDLNQEHRRLAHAANLIEGCATALRALEEGGEGASTGVADELEAVLARLRALSAYDEALADPLELLANAQIQLQEAGHALRRYQDRLELEPQRLAELEGRIATVIAAARKYRVGPEALPERLSELQTRLAELNLLADPAGLAAYEASAKAEYEVTAAKLSAGREIAAVQLAEAVTAAMQRLAMTGGRFEIALDRLASGTAHGMESIGFQVSTNAGQPLRPLAKVASGGELSRIGLAIQVIASQAARVPTLIFDEIDVGIGGRVAEIVGRMLHELGTSRQVLCVTHLPQVAACADWQWSVAKEETGGQTLSTVTVLDHAQRVSELARMLGGIKITEATRRHAAELLAKP